MNSPFLSMSLVLLGLHGNAAISDQPQRSAAEGRRESGDSKAVGLLIPLDESLSPLQDRFNADMDQRRVLLILSPT